MNKQNNVKCPICGKIGEMVKRDNHTMECKLCHSISFYNEETDEYILSDFELTELNKGDIYDVFISTKISLKTEDNPNLVGVTKDSILALELYHELTRNGLKVFYSDMMLGGINYEAQVNSALMRSKYLLVVSTKKEYLECSWVKSEWEKWLYLIDKGYKNQNGLKLYIPKRNYFELPYKLHKFQIFDNPLQVISSFEGNIN